MATAKQHTPTDKVAVILRSSAKPGIRNCGDYLPDRTYSVDTAEAKRLVECKGFEYVTPGDKAAATTTRSEG